MAELLPGTIWNQHEFSLKDAGATNVTGACGGTTLANAESWARQAPVLLADVYRRMRANNLGEADGRATLDDLVAQALRDGFSCARWKSGPIGDFFAKHAGIHAIIYLTANGQALVDSISGKGEDAVNLQNHILMLAGRHEGGVVKDGLYAGRALPAGYWACDPDNWAIRHAPVPNNILQFYPDAVVAASQPQDAFALFPLAASPAPAPAPPVKGAPGWTDDGTTLSGPNGVPVVRGFRDYVLTELRASAWDIHDVPEAAEYWANPVDPGLPELGGGTRQDFGARHADGYDTIAALGWTQHDGIFRIPLGREIATLKGHISDLQDERAAVERERDTAAAARDAALASLSDAQKARDAALAGLTAARQETADVRAQVQAQLDAQKAADAEILAQVRAQLQDQIDARDRRIAELEAAQQHVAALREHLAALLTELPIPLTAPAQPAAATPSEGEGAPG